MNKFCTGAKGFGHETQSCCEKHDQDYSVDSLVSRNQADIALLICVSAHGRPWRAIAMFIAVRIFGWLRYKGKY